MRTRLLERTDVLRASVKRAEVLKANGGSVLLKTWAVVAGKGKQVEGREQEGRVALDVVGDNILWVRYAEGESLPDNTTAMVVGAPDRPSHCKIVSRSRAVEISTGKMRATVGLDPYRVEVHRAEGGKICGIGGPEKNNFRIWDSYNTGICRSCEDGSPIAVESFDLGHDECIYGLGEKFIKLNKVGQTIDLNTTDALGVATPRSYKNVPLLVSNRGYGVFFNHSSLMTYWVGSMSAVDIQVAAEDDFLDYYVIVGDIKWVLSSYTDLTGKGSLPPKWSFGYWQSKCTYHSAEETLGVARKFRENEIPCDVIHIDTHWFKKDWLCDLEFDAERFPDPGGFIEQLRRIGFKLSLWQRPYISEGSKLFDDLKAVDGFVRNDQGGVHNVGKPASFEGIVGVIDFTNAEAVRVYQEALRKLLRLGVKVIKTDFGEAAPLDGVYHGGMAGSQVHNLYPLLYNKAAFEVIKEETGEGIEWARSAWAGSQRYPVHWGGDPSGYYHNMVPQLQGGLSLGLSGFQFWSHDIGGFFHRGFSDSPPDEQLLIRWMQVGMFMSHSRLHSDGDREPYRFSPETMRICREYIRLRYRLMPYIYGSAIKCVEESLPMVRPLVIEYQDDPNVWNIGDEFLFGDSLLVAPVFTEGSRRRVYLPQGMWTYWWTRERISGGRWIEVDADIETLPGGAPRRTRS